MSIIIQLPFKYYMKILKFIFSVINYLQTIYNIYKLFINQQHNSAIFYNYLYQMYLNEIYMQ